MQNALTSTGRSVLIVFACVLFALTLGACKSGQKGSLAKIAGDPPVEWRLVKMDGREVQVKRPVTLRLDNEHRASGQSFINNYFGPFTIGADDAFAFGQVGSTMMAGEQDLMESEQQYFALLARVNRFSVKGDMLTFRHDDESLLEFVRQVN